jgi:hypothetical protein
VAHGVGVGGGAQMEFGLVSERTWPMVFENRIPTGSVLPRHALADEEHDPNDEASEAAVRYWLQWSDGYTFPHVVLFDSWEDLVAKLATVRWGEVSAAMLRHSWALQANTTAAWAAALRGVVRARDRPSGSGLARLSRRERLDAVYGAGGWSDYGP